MPHVQILAPAYATMKVTIRREQRSTILAHQLAAIHAAPPARKPAKILATRPARILVLILAVLPVIGPVAEHVRILAVLRVQIIAERHALIHVAARVPVPARIHVIKRVLQHATTPVVFALRLVA